MLLIGMMLVTGCGAGTPDPGPGASDAGAGVRPTAGVVTDETQNEWPAVGLGKMALDRSEPEAERRNPFRFGALTPPTTPSAPPSGPVVEPGPPVAPVPIEPSTPPRGADPPGDADGFRLTFVGFVESPGIEGRVVVLTDGETVFHGREGEVIDGRYRIVGIGIESVDVEQIDGRGRQTLRLSSGL